MKLLASNALNGVLAATLPAFERAQGVAVELEYGSTNRILERMAAGATADLVIATDKAIDGLIAQGKLAAPRTDLASAGMGLCVKKGAPKPDIATVDAFKHALRAAKSIGYTSSGQSGVAFAALIDRLGIAAMVKAKAVIHQGGLIGEIVARDEAELGVQQISEILAVPGVDLVGPLPPDIQTVTMFSAALGAGTREAATAGALVAFLRTDETKRVMQKKGLEPA